MAHDKADLKRLINKEKRDIKKLCTNAFSGNYDSVTLNALIYKLLDYVTLNAMLSDLHHADDMEQEIVNRLSKLRVKNGLKETRKN